MIRKKKATGKPVIDLTGPQGNAFFILGLVDSYGRQLEMSEEDMSSLKERMQSGDYENLLLEFDKVFGDYVILER